MGFFVYLFLVIIAGSVAGYLIYRFVSIRSERKICKNIQEKINNQKMIYLTDGKEVKIVDEKIEEKVRFIEVPKKEIPLPKPKIKVKKKKIIKKKKKVKKR